MIGFGRYGCAASHLPTVFVPLFRVLALHPMDTMKGEELGKNGENSGKRQAGAYYVCHVLYVVIFIAFVLQLAMLFLLDVLRNTALSYFFTIECFLRPQTTFRRAKCVAEEIGALGWQRLGLVEKLRLWVLLWNCRLRGIVRRTNSTSNFLFQQTQKGKRRRENGEDRRSSEEHNGFLVEKKIGVLEGIPPTYTSEKSQKLPDSDGDASYDLRLVFSRRYRRLEPFINSNGNPDASRWRFWLGLPSDSTNTDFLFTFQPHTRTGSGSPAGDITTKDTEELRGRILEVIGAKNTPAQEKTNTCIELRTSSSCKEQYLQSDRTHDFQLSDKVSDDSSNLEPSLNSTSMLGRRFMARTKVFRRGERAKIGLGHI